MKTLMIRPSRFGFSNQLDPLFNDLFRAPLWGDQDGSFLPAVDISEAENEFTLTFELPGLDKREIKVGVEDNVLTVSGERRRRKEEKGENYIRSEISSGRFSRSSTLPKTIDSGQVTADYKDGLLMVLRSIQ